MLRALAATYWGEGDKHLDDPKTYRSLFVIVTDEGDPMDPTLEDFAAGLAKQLDAEATP